MCMKKKSSSHHQQRIPKQTQWTFQKQTVCACVFGVYETYRSEESERERCEYVFISFCEIYVSMQKKKKISPSTEPPKANAMNFQKQTKKQVQTWQRVKTPPIAHWVKSTRPQDQSQAVVRNNKKSKCKNILEGAKKM